MPVREFCSFLGPSCAVVVDGAHAAGQLELDLPSLGCVAYTANLHKWFFTPKGWDISSLPSLDLPLPFHCPSLTVHCDSTAFLCNIRCLHPASIMCHSQPLCCCPCPMNPTAEGPSVAACCSTAFLWVAPEHHSAVLPTVIGSESPFFGAGGAVESGKEEAPGQWALEYEYTGTRDYSGFCSLSSAFKFRASLHPGGEAALIRHGHDMALWAGEYLSTLWGTSVMQPPEMTAWCVPKLPSPPSPPSPPPGWRRITMIELPFGLDAMGGISLVHDVNATVIVIRAPHPNPSRRRSHHRRRRRSGRAAALYPATSSCRPQRT